jgi:hypothetical protein
MNGEELAALYERKGLSKEETQKALDAYEKFSDFLNEHSRSIETAERRLLQNYLDGLIADGTNSISDLIAIARAAYLAKNYDLYFYLAGIAERDTVIDNLTERIDRVAGSAVSQQVAQLRRPPTGAPPQQALSFTEGLMQALRESLSEEACRKTLTGNAHGIPAKVFTDEREKYLALGSIDEYLKDFHLRSVEKLQEHAESGLPWFEQIITPRVVEFVSGNQEVLGGIRRGNKIYLTKIPFDPNRWLTERDPAKKRYYACHCPMAREFLNGRGRGIDPLWCTCSAGFAKLRFDIVFDTETEVEVVETVFAGDDRCRFAVTIP